MLHVCMQSLAYQLRDPFLLSQAPLAIGSFEGLWHPCSRIESDVRLLCIVEVVLGKTGRIRLGFLNLLTIFAQRLNEEVVQATLYDC